MSYMGLRARMVLFITLLVAVIAAFIAAYFPGVQERTALESLDQRARNVCEILAKLIAPAVEFDDPADAQKQLAAVRGDRDLVYLAALRANGTVFARHANARVGSSAREHLVATTEPRVTIEGGLLHVQVPLAGKGGQLGTLAGGFSLAPIQAVRKSSQRTAMVIGAAVLLIGLLVAWLLSGSIARPLLGASRQLMNLSNNLVALARGQEAAGAQQGAGIEETRRTMEMVLGSAQQIAEKSSNVLGNAERTVRGNRDVSQRIHELNTHAEKVAEILATIMQVADRTDLLALNAALEGTKAGEAGRGFTLVAGEMRRLAESVMESVAGIRRLMNDVRTASHAAVQAGQDGVALSEETTRSARDIALVTQQQRHATEQVGHSMDEMADIVNHTLGSTRQAARTAAELAEVASSLAGLISRSAQVESRRGSAGTNGVETGERPRNEPAAPPPPA